MEVRTRSRPPNTLDLISFTLIFRQFLTSASPRTSHCSTKSPTRSTLVQEQRYESLRIDRPPRAHCCNCFVPFSKRQHKGSSHSSRSIPTRGSVCPTSFSKRRANKTRYAWILVDRRLALRQPSLTVIPYQFLGLQILEKIIRVRWKALPEDQRQGQCFVWQRSLNLLKY